MAENVGFVKCFLKGVVEKTSYRKLVANLYFVYSAMEEEMEKLPSHPVVSKICFRKKIQVKFIQIHSKVLSKEL